MSYHVLANITTLEMTIALIKGVNHTIYTFIGWVTVIFPLQVGP